VVVDGIALAPAFEYLPSVFGSDAEHMKLASFVRSNHACLGWRPDGPR
jgi:hypothetical protein